MPEVPNRYDDPYWTQVAEQAGAKYALPSGLMAAIVTKGERSNNDQVSSAQAKTPFQIIPSTRDLFLKKYGVDAYLSPENAANVAALHIRESLDRGASVPRAVAEYNGGADPARWDKTVPSYVSRVLGGLADGVSRETASAQPKSTFQTVLESRPQATSQLSKIYDAYKSGKMSAQDAQEYEADIKAGTIMLPKGATLIGKETVSGNPLPAPILNAYKSGKMPAADMAELEKDVKAGMWTLPQGEKLTAKLSDQVPGHVEQPAYVEPGLAEKWVGAHEAGLSMASGMVAAPLAAVGGVVSNLVSGKFGTPEGVKVADDKFKAIQEALTYQPRTAGGKAVLADAGNVLDASKLAGIGPAEAMGMAGAVGTVKPAIAVATPNIVTAAKTVANPAGEVLAKAKAAGAAPTPGTMASGGSAAVDVATLRQLRADELPVPVKLTEGQKTRAFDAQRFERETAKDPALGEPIRQRFSEQNRQLTQNLDAFIDLTGAESPDVRSIGLSVDKAIRDRAARDKARIRVLYHDAEKAGEMESPVNIAPVADYLNKNRAGRTSAPILQTVADEIGVQGIGGGKLADGTVTTGPATLRQVEELRKSINKFVNDADPNDIRVAGELKALIDATTEGAGGKAYAAARRARALYGRDYENISLVKNIIGNKRGSADRAIALEDVLNRAVITPASSLDDVRNIRRLLQTAGDNGQQAWKELQGGTLKYIRDQAIKNVARNELGDPIVSAAQLDRTITALDRSGKLDFIFGKKGAEQLRTINEVAKDVLVAPPGSVNTSNTASVLLAAMDMAISGSAGLPVPVLSGLRMAVKGVKNAKTKARVTQALK